MITRSQNEWQGASPSQELVRAIYSALSNKDCFEIFKLASSGIDASTEILRQRQFTRKRYYVRLRELVRLGLVHKESGKYVQTSLGMTVYNTTRQLEQAILN